MADPISFNQAYALARKNKISSFTWNGKKYSSDIDVKEKSVTKSSNNKSNVISKAADTVRQTLTSEARNPGILTRILGSIPGGSVVSGAINALSLLPVNARQMVLKTLGLPTNLSEKDFNDDERLAIYNAIKSRQEKTGNNKKGSILYSDYGETGPKLASGKYGLDDLAMNSFRDPKFRMAATLGESKWRDKGDSIIVKDQYDFSKGAFKNTKNSSIYKMIRSVMGDSENKNPTQKQIKEMAVRIALSKKDMEALNKNK